MIDTNHPRLGIVRQCELVRISRSSFYFEDKGENLLNLQLMRVIDEAYLKMPWYGSRQMKRHLKRLGYGVGRKRVRRLMRLMGLRSLAPQPQTSRRNPAHPVYPYLLHDIAVERANQVWCTDLTYIPMAHGFLYLIAIMDWHTRKVLSWRLSNTQDTTFCLEALDEAIEQYGGCIEVYVSTSLEVCEQRDRKGLYAKARAGIIKEFTGISDPYEEPKTPEVDIDTQHISPDNAAHQILIKLESLGFIR